MNAGIDYGLGKSNINLTTGIRYGVISQHSILPEWIDDFEQDYGEPHCPKCGNAVSSTTDKELPDEEWPHYSKYGCSDYVCETCEHWLDSENVHSDESQGFSYEGDGYILTNCLDTDIFVIKSLYYTFAQFCSPCVPGAGNLDNYIADGVKTYCLGREWFEGGKAPYPVYRVSDNMLVSR